jgi:hypothetical protein
MCTQCTLCTGGRYDTILGFCGELCDLTKPVGLSLAPSWALSKQRYIQYSVYMCTQCTLCTGDRYDTILGFCGKLCNLTKPVEPGSFMGTVKAKVYTVQCTMCIQCTMCTSKQLMYSTYMDIARAVCVIR